MWSTVRHLLFGTAFTVGVAAAVVHFDVDVDEELSRLRARLMEYDSEYPFHVEAHAISAVCLLIFTLSFFLLRQCCNLYVSKPLVLVKAVQYISLDQFEKEKKQFTHDKVT